MYVYGATCDCVYVYVGMLVSWWLVLVLIEESQKRNQSIGQDGKEVKLDV